MRALLEELPGFVEELVVFGSSFSGARLSAVGPQWDGVSGYGIDERPSHEFALVGGEIGGGH